MAKGLFQKVLKPTDKDLWPNEQPFDTHKVISLLNNNFYKIPHSCYWLVKPTISVLCMFFLGHPCLPPVSDTSMVPGVWGVGVDDAWDLTSTGKQPTCWLWASPPTWSHFTVAQFHWGLQARDLYSGWQTVKYLIMLMPLCALQQLSLSVGSGNRQKGQSFSQPRLTRRGSSSDSQPSVLWALLQLGFVISLI